MVNFINARRLGQAFPLKTVEETVRILSIYNGSNDFEGIYGKRVLRMRFEIEYIELAERNVVGNATRLSVWRRSDSQDSTHFIFAALQSDKF